MHSEVLTLNRLPARLNVQQTAALLGFLPHEIPVLVRAKLLEPLGRPAPNAQKYFASCDLLKLSTDSHWLGRATQAVSKHWQHRNEGQKPHSRPLEVAT